MAMWVLVHRWRLLGGRVCLLFPLALTACATSAPAGSSPGVMDSMLQIVGLQRVSLQNQDLPAAAASMKPEKKLQVVIRLHAGELLNTDTNGRSLPVVARIYELGDKDAFMRAPAATFNTDRRQWPSELAGEVLGVREVVLTPGQHFDATETLPVGTRYVGVVALFRAPAPGRWRHVFDAKAAAQGGLTLGVHACALSVASGQALDAPLEMTRLAGVQCS